MNKNYNKKILVYTIIIIFVGAAITPNILGYENKGKIILSKFSSKSFPTDRDDYINAYWKFDECSGDTVEDSSAHNYDGLRHGATWTTEGYSGCALDFDGVDDYVDLTDHVRGIAVNKTDDYIISFYFKSTSDNQGIILSLTGYKNVPEFRIEIQPNGSLLFKIWTGLCGMVLFSGEGYNDGDLHEVEIIFNGLSTDPTMKIYVDNDLDGELTDWLCPIESVDYLAAAIGKRASDYTGFFDGIIDEFEFIVYEQGNDQGKPTIDGPTNGEPNVEYEYSFITVDPEGDDILKLNIDWDDGNVEEKIGPFESGEEVKVSHTWTEEDRFDVKAKSFDVWDDGPWSEPYEVKIGNQPPDEPTISGKKYGDAQEQIEYTFVAYDYEEEDIKFYIDWGDGTISETSYQPSGTPYIEEHSWDTENDYYIMARSIDINNKYKDWSVYHIRIGDKPPNMPKIYGAVQGLPGIEYEYAFISSDPENDNVTYEIDWGDDNIETDIGPIPSGEILVRTHTWNKTHTYTIKVRSKDEFDYYTDWSEHDVIIPRNSVYKQNLLKLLFERIPYTALIFKWFYKLII